MNDIDEDFDDLMGDEAPVRSRQKEEKPRRRRRNDVGGLSDTNLGVPEHAKDPNYEYRWINDTGSRRLHNKTVHDDWDVVTYDQTGQEMAPQDVGGGTQIARVAGTHEGGGPMRTYLCRKPKEFYEEDKAAEQARIDELEATIKKGPTEDANALESSHAYLPMGANQIG